MARRDDPAADILSVCSAKDYGTRDAHSRSGAMPSPFGSSTIRGIDDSPRLNLRLDPNLGDGR